MESWNLLNSRFSSVLRVAYCVLRSACSVLRVACRYELAWRPIHTLTHDGWLTHDGSLDARLVLFRVCVRQNAGSTERGMWQLSKYCTVQVYIIVRTGPKVELAQKSRALLYSDLVRQTNRHASSEPSCVKRTVMRQPSEYEINSTVSLFLLFGPSCVNRHASKYELAFRAFILGRPIIGKEKSTSIGGS